MKTLIVITIVLLALSGCSSQITPPVQLEDNPQTTINQGIIKKYHVCVPQDEFLKSQDWRASLSVHKGRYYLPNEKVIKTFYYAHHAYKIRLTGDSQLIHRYKRYFQRNGVTAIFCLNPVHWKDKYHVDMIFSHLKEDLEIPRCNTFKSKNMNKATSPVIQI